MKVPLGGGSEGFSALSKQQGPCARAPKGSLGPQSLSYIRAPEAPEGPWAPCIWGPNLEPMGPHPFVDSILKKKLRHNVTFAGLRRVTNINICYWLPKVQNKANIWTSFFAKLGICIAVYRKYPPNLQQGILGPTPFTRGPELFSYEGAPRRRLRSVLGPQQAAGP